MSKNEFDRKVREELEGLRLKPSEEVWSQVIAGIQPAKRRRRWLIWIPFLFIGLGGGGYWFLEGDSIEKSKLNLNSTQVSNENKNEVTSEPEVSKQNEENLSSGESISPGKKQEMTASSNDASKERRNEEQLFTRGASGKSKNTSTKNDSRSKNHNKPRNSKYLNKPTKVSEEVETNKTNKKEKAVESETNTTKDSLVIDTAFAVVTPNLDEDKTSMDSSKNLMPQARVDINEESDSASIAKSLAKPPSFEFPKWEFGFTVRGGYSNIHSDFFLLNASRQLADYNSGSGSAYQPPGYMGDSLNKKSAFSWGAGFYVQRNINERLAITGGITYHQYNFQIKVGSKVDSTVFISNPLSSTVVYNYYRGGNSSEYKNRFHYIEVPLAVSFQLNKGKNIPIRWDVGITPGFLVSSDFLYPDFARNIYYQDNSMLRKMQWSLQTGFTVGLLSRQKHSIQIGPQVQYMFTNLVKDDASKQHLGFVGLRANLKLWNSKPMQR